jgi:hypothetical protein
MHSSTQFYLAAGVSILRHLLGVFLHPFNPKVSRTSRERGLVHTLFFSVVLGKDSTGFSSPLLAIFFFFCFIPSTHGFPLLLPLFSRLLHPLSLHGFGHLCFSLTLISSLTLKECACCWLLGFLLGKAAAAMVFAGRFLGRGLDSSFHAFGHLCFSLILPSSPTFHGDACSWVCWFCFGKRGCCRQGCWLAVLWGEEDGKSMHPVLERVPLSLSLLHLYPS